MTLSSRPLLRSRTAGETPWARIDDALAVGNIVDFVDEDGAFFGQLVHNIAVMDNLAADVDGGAEGFKSDLHDVDGAYDAGAKTARLEQQHPLLTGGRTAGAVMGSGFGDSTSHIFEYTNGRD